MELLEDRLQTDENLKDLLFVVISTVRRNLTPTHDVLRIELLKRYEFQNGYDLMMLSSPGIIGYILSCLEDIEEMRKTEQALRPLSHYDGAIANAVYSDSEFQEYFDDLRFEKRNGKILMRHDNSNRI